MFRTLINSSRSERFWLETLAQDIRIALRLLRRAPSVTAIALLSIALSVGETAVVFTAIEAVLLKPLPYERPSELVQLRTDEAGAGRSHGDWVFWNGRRKSSGAPVHSSRSGFIETLSSTLVEAQLRRKRFTASE